MVLGILSSGLGSTDLRLTLDLNRVFIRVDFPRPLCPEQENTHIHTQLETLGTHSLVVLDSHKGNLAKHKSLIQLNPKSFYFVPMTSLVM